MELRHTTRIPVAEAAYNGHLDVLTLLLRKGGNPHIRCNAFSLGALPAALPPDQYVQKLTPMWLYPPVPRPTMSLVDVARRGVQECGCGASVTAAAAI